MPKTAQADTSVALDTANDLVKVATVYKTQPNTQTEILSKVLEFKEFTLPQTPGFVNSSILKGQEGTEVVVLSQWQDLPSFEAYSQEYSKDKLDSDRPQTFIFEVQKAETRGLKPAIAESGAIMFQSI
ncbi:MAG: antibiotic biosynthesis monooxygenase [Xenococcaceae cyanobacterium]